MSPAPSPKALPSGLTVASRRQVVPASVSCPTWRYSANLWSRSSSLHESKSIFGSSANLAMQCAPPKAQRDEAKNCRKTCWLRTLSRLPIVRQSTRLAKVNSSFVGDKGGANAGGPANSRGRVEADAQEHDGFSLTSQQNTKTG